MHAPHEAAEIGERSPLHSPHVLVLDVLGLGRVPEIGVVEARALVVVVSGTIAAHGQVRLEPAVIDGPFGENGLAVGCEFHHVDVGRCSRDPARQQCKADEQTAGTKKREAGGE